MSVDVTLTSYILNPWTNSGSTPIGYHGGTSNLIALSYANLDFTPSASDPYKSTSGDVFKVYVNGVRIYRQSDQDYAGGSGFLEDGDTSGQTLNGVSAAWTATNNTVWEINTALQLILLNVDSTTGVASTTLYGPSGLNVSFAESSSSPIIELRRAVQDLKTPAIDFSNASILTEQDLDNSAKNVFHVSQQAVISTENAMLFDSGTDTYKATQPGTSNAKRISNVATPSADTDAANKAYADGGAAGQAILANSSSIAKIGTGHDGTDALTGQNSNLTQINAVANNAPNINAVANDAVDIGAVAGKEAEIGRLGTPAMATATTGHIPVLANVVEQTVNYTVTVASSKFNIQGGVYGSATETPALTLIRGYTYVFDTSDSTVATHPLVFKNGSTTLGTSDGVTTTGTAGQAGAKVTVVVSDSVTITKYSCSTHGDGMGNTITLRHDDFKEVADVSSDITTVAGQIAPTNNLSTVAGLNSELTTVANSAYKTDIQTVANSTYKDQIETLANSTYQGQIQTVAETNYKNKVETVAGDTNAINSIFTNIGQVTTFADTYHPAGTTEPSTSNVTEGDLWFDNNTGVKALKVYDGSSWGLATSSISSVASTSEFTASNGQGTGNKYFAVNHDVGLELVFLNGVRLKRGSDYYCTNSNTSTTPISSGNGATFVRLETVPGSSDILSVMAFGQIANNLAVNTAGGTFTGAVTFEGQNTHNTGSNTFTMPTTRGLDEYVLTRDDSVGTGGTAWKETITSPGITSVTTPASDNSINEDDNVTMTINGSNFNNTMTVSLVDATSNVTVTGHGNLGIASFVNSAQITVNTVAATSNISNSSVKVKLDKSGLTATSSSISVSPDPTFSAPSSNGTTLATIMDARGGNSEVIGASGIVASSGSDAITYALDQTSTNANNTWQFNTTTGVVTSPTAGVYDVPSGISYTEPFTVTATAGGNSLRTDSRTFNIVVSKSPTGGTNGSGGSTLATYDGYRYHAFLSNGTFELFSNTVCDILIVAGGGASGYHVGGGGGGGGIVTMMNYTISTGQATITVGGGRVTSDNTGEFSQIVFPASAGTQKVQGGGYSGGWSTAEGADGANGGGDGINNAGSYDNNNGGQGQGATGTFALLSQSGATITYYGGYDGGHTANFANAHYHPAAGGGGATAAGGTPPNSESDAGDGGDGKQITWVTPDALGFTSGSGTHNGVAYNTGFYFSGGGGGSIENTGAGGDGGKGGGGGGSKSHTAPSQGTEGSPGTGGINNATAANQGYGNHGGANTGGGAGGNYQSGQTTNGGSGIVVIRYAI